MRWTPQWFRRLDVELAQLATYTPDEARAVRRALAVDPIAFAMIYLADPHLRGKRDATGERGPVTFNEIHFEWAELAEQWRTPTTRPAEWRHGFVAPRKIGKSTWWFLILPLWAAANGHIRFVAAFAHSDDQTRIHVQTFKDEIDRNALLRADYPDLCTPMRRPGGMTVSDRQDRMEQKSGFIFAGKGIDATSLGMKRGAERPDLIILDDIEPDEKHYTAELAAKRLATMTDAILPLNIDARVVLTGTTTMPGSITHQLVKAANRVEVAEWIAEEGFTPHHYVPIVTDDDGTERSVWPSAWPLEWLNERRHTREYAKNYLNDPMARDGDYWNRDDFTYGTPPNVTKWLLSIDPAVTTKRTSDLTGIALVGYAPPVKESAHFQYAQLRAQLVDGAPPLPPASTSRCVVEHAEAVRLVGKALRRHVVALLQRYADRGIVVGRVLVEVNQGGEVWGEILHDLPCGDPTTVHQHEPKEVRAARVLAHYQAGRVTHARKLAAAEEQMVGFPKAPNDDLVDAVGSGVTHFLDPPASPRRAQIKVRNYS